MPLALCAGAVALALTAGTLLRVEPGPGAFLAMAALAPAPCLR